MNEIVIIKTIDDAKQLFNYKPTQYELNNINQFETLDNKVGDTIHYN